MAITETIEQQLQAIDEKIEKSLARIKTLKAKRQELLEKKEASAMQEITKILQEKNLSAEQAVEILRNHNTQ